MLIKSFTAFKLDEPFQMSDEDIEKKMAEYLYKPASKAETYKYGFVSPFSTPDAELFTSANGCLLFTVMYENKVVPGSAIQNETDKRIAEKEAKMEGAKLGQKEKWVIKTEVKGELIMKAFSKFNKVHCYIDKQLGYLIVGTTSNAKIDDALRLFREGLGLRNLTTLSNTFEPVSAILTDWIYSNEFPDALYPGSSVTLTDSADSKVRGTFRNQELISEEITTCINSSKIVESIDLEYNDQINFTLTRDLVFKKINVNDSYAEDDQELPEDDSEAMNYVVVANWLITVSAIKDVLPEFKHWFVELKDNAASA